MVLKILKKKLHFYRKFELDVWGFYLTKFNLNKKITNIFNEIYLKKLSIISKKNLRYIYRIDIDQPSIFKKKQKWKFLTKKLSRLFYLTLSHNQFRRLYLIASKAEGLRESNFILLIENRLICMLYRMNFLLNMFELRSFISNGNVLINNKIITYCNKFVNYGEIVKIKFNCFKLIKLNMIKRFLNNNYYFNTPRYLFVNYKLMFGFAYKEPVIKDLTFPIKSIDIYRGADIF